MTDSLNIFFVIPLLNEDQNIERVFTDIKYNFSGKKITVLFVDDGSTDQSLERIKKLKSLHPLEIEYLSFSKNCGKEVAIFAGLEWVVNKKFCGAILMDADGQHLATDALRLYQAAIDEDLDIVFGARAERSYQSTLGSFLSQAFYKFFNRFAEINLDPQIGDFNFLSKKAVKAILSFKEKKPFMKGVYASIGFRTKKIEIEISDRHAGITKFNWARKISLALTGLTSFSIQPLRFIFIIGLLSFVTSIILVLSIFAQYFIEGVFQPGYYTMLVLNLLFFGITMLSIGIIGEYIGRIHDETRNRPIYLINEQSDNKDND